MTDTAMSNDEKFALLQNSFQEQNESLRNELRELQKHYAHSFEQIKSQHDSELNQFKLYTQALEQLKSQNASELEQLKRQVKSQQSKETQRTTAAEERIREERLVLNIKMDHYSGESDSIKFRNFMNNIKKYLVTHRLSADGLMQLIALNLDDKAYEWFSIHPFDSLEEFEERARAQFVREDTKIEAYGKLAVLKYHNNIDAFNRVFERNSNLPTTSFLPEEAKLAIYGYALPHYVQVELKRKNINTLVDALAFTSIFINKETEKEASQHKKLQYKSKGRTTISSTDAKNNSLTTNTTSYHRNNNYQYNKNRYTPMSSNTGTQAMEIDLVNTRSNQEQNSTKNF